MNGNKLKKILAENKGSENIVDILNTELEAERIKEIEDGIEKCGLAISNLNEQAENNKADLSMWLAGVESGEGAQASIIDIKSKNIVIKNIEDQRKGFEELREELKEMLPSDKPEEATEH